MPPYLPFGKRKPAASKFLSLCRGSALWLTLVVSGAALGAFQFAPTAAYAQGVFDGGQIANVVVQGNQRVETASILTLANLQAGTTSSAEKLNKATKALYGSGFFRDVNVSRSGNQVIIKVMENPIVNEIAYEGNYAVKAEIFDGETKLKPRSIVTNAKIKADLQRMLAVYKASGRYDVQIEPKLIRLSQNRVNLVYEISEGPKSKIRSINFIGNRAYTDRRLRREILSRQATWWRFLGAPDTYDPARISVDEEVLRKFYFKNGYADFEVETTLGELRETDRSFAVTISVKEGPKFRVGRINIDSELTGIAKQELLSAVTFKAGDPFNGDEVTDSVEAIREAIGNRGFAFIEVEPDLDKNVTQKKVDISFKLSKGPKVFVEKINITGNTATLDRVIRREMRVVEGDAFSVSKVRQSVSNIRNLGFFDPNIQVRDTRGSAPDRVVLDFEVEEANTGELSFGASYSSNGGIAGQFGFKQNNLLGRGTRMNLDISASALSKTATFGITEPYFLGRNMTAGTNLSYSDVDRTDTSGYTEKSYGAGVTIGYRINDNLTQNWSANARYSEIDPTVTTALSPFLQDEQGDTLRVILGHSLNWNRLDSLQSPRSGFSFNMSNQYAGLGGDVQYLKNTVVARAFYPLGDYITIAAKAEGGILNPLDNSFARVGDRYRMGDDKVRGFASDGIGPRIDSASSTSPGVALGGTKFYAAKAELRAKVPNPLEFDIQARLFADMGALWDPQNPYGATVINDSSDPRASYGVGFTWQSPIGPLALDWGWPLEYEDFDQLQRFSFRISSGF